AGSLTNTILRDTVSGSLGGGLHKSGGGALTIDGIEVTGNSATDQGGGLWFGTPGTVTVNNALVTNNTTTTSGGGGIVSGTTVTITNSTVANNTAGGFGGGIFSGSVANTTIVNSTFSGNHGTEAGGIAATGPATLRNVTVVGNVGTLTAGGIAIVNAGSQNLVNVLLSGNLLGAAPANCGINGTGVFTSNGHNLSDDASCTALTQPSDKNNTAAGVSAALAANGGPTPTHALQTGSAAIDAGLAGSCTATDQRGFARVGTCDIGAFEFGAVSAGSPRISRPRP
ncbi:MAG: choice-of-anchor Q domain-containing protein, partial [Gemmatimonadales bacterium]